MTVAEVIEVKMKKRLVERKCSLDGIVVFDISGGGGGIWTVDLDNIKIEKKDHEKPRVRIKISDVDFLNMVEGKLNPITATFTGKLKIEGDMSAAMKLGELLK